MSKYDIKLTEEVRGILERSVIEGNKLVLPPGMLPPPLYKAVNKILECAGGKWNRSAKGHIFPSDPSTRLGLAMKTGHITDTKKALNAFYTPPAIAGIAASYLEICPGCTVLEPSAGAGALAHAANEIGADVTCLEINPEECKNLRSQGFEEFEADFLKVTPADIAKWTHSNPKGGLFDGVLMNPPFAVGQDVDHVTHALKFLKRGGKLVSIIAKSFTFRNDKRYTTFREATFPNHNGQIVKELPEGTFSESGTNIATLIITLEK